MRSKKTHGRAVTRFQNDSAQQQTDILSIYHNRNDSTTTADVIILETSYLEAAKPELEKYDVLTKQIKAAIKTRKELQAEKKATPILNVLKHRELTSRIEDLTEQLEDLRSERAIILMYLDCEESRDTAEVKKRCTAAETMLEKLEVSEAKYSYALDDAKNAFADLQEQAKDLDAGELYEARLAIRNEKEQNAVQQLQKAYGEQFTPATMLHGRRDVEKVLNERAEPPQSVQEEKRNRQAMAEDPPRQIPKRNEIEL